MKQFFMRVTKNRKQAIRIMIDVMAIVTIKLQMY